MDRDLWMTSSRTTLGVVLASQADMDDVLRAASSAPRAKRRDVRAQRRALKATTAERARAEAADAMAAAGREESHRA